MSNDRYIEMTPENLAQAIFLATASTPASGHGPCKTEWLHNLAGDSEFLECSYTRTDDGETLIAAITGNGPTSAANAAFYCDARAIVLGMAKRIAELERAMGSFGSHIRWRHG